MPKYFHTVLQPERPGLHRSKSRQVQRRRLPPLGQVAKDHAEGKARKYGCTQSQKLG